LVRIFVGVITGDAAARQDHAADDGQDEQHFAATRLARLAHLTPLIRLTRLSAERGRRLSRWHGRSRRCARRERAALRTESRIGAQFVTAVAALHLDAPPKLALLNPCARLLVSDSNLCLAVIAVFDNGAARAKRL